MSSYEANGQVIRQHMLLDAQYLDSHAGSSFSSSFLRGLYHFGSVFVLSICIYYTIRLAVASVRFIRKRLYRGRSLVVKPFDIEKDAPTNNSLTFPSMASTTNVSRQHQIVVDTAVPELSYSPDLDSNSSTAASPSSISPNLSPYSPCEVGANDIYTFPKRTAVSQVGIRSSMDGFSLKAR
jgi:hypothetical protein